MTKEIIYFQEVKAQILDCKSFTSKHLAKEARSFAPKSIPTEQAMPATKAAKVAAYLDIEIYGKNLRKRSKLCKVIWFVGE